MPSAIIGVAETTIDYESCCLMSHASRTIRVNHDTTGRSDDAYADPMPSGHTDRGAAFGALIRTAFDASGWTQDRFALETGISRATLNRWLAGHAKHPEADQVRAACRALGIDPRRAAVALGYLTEDDLSPNTTPAMAYTSEVGEALEILADPDLPEAKRAEALSYLRWVRSEAQRTKPDQRSAG